MIVWIIMVTSKHFKLRADHFIPRVWLVLTSELFIFALRKITSHQKLSLLSLKVKFVYLKKNKNRMSNGWPFMHVSYLLNGKICPPSMALYQAYWPIRLTEQGWVLGSPAEHIPLSKRWDQIHCKNQRVLQKKYALLITSMAEILFLCYTSGTSLCTDNYLSLIIIWKNLQVVIARKKLTTPHSYPNWCRYVHECVSNYTTQLP